MTVGDGGFTVFRMATVHAEILALICWFDMQVSLDTVSLDIAILTLVSKNTICCADHVAVNLIVGWWQLGFSKTVCKDSS